MPKPTNSAGSILAHKGAASPAPEAGLGAPSVPLGPDPAQLEPSGPAGPRTAERERATCNASRAKTASLGATLFRSGFKKRSRAPQGADSDRLARTNNAAEDERDGTPEAPGRAAVRRGEQPAYVDTRTSQYQTPAPGERRSPWQ